MLGERDGPGTFAELEEGQAHAPERVPFAAPGPCVIESAARKVLDIVQFPEFCQDFIFAFARFEHFLYLVKMITERFPIG